MSRARSSSSSSDGKVTCRVMAARGSAEGEGEGSGSRLEELDLEEVVGDRARLPDELVHPLLAKSSLARLVDVDSVRGALRLPIDVHAEADLLAPRLRRHHQIHVACVEPVGNPASGRAYHGPVTGQGPGPREGPAVEGESRRNGIRTGHPGLDPGRGEVLGSPEANVVLP